MRTKMFNVVEIGLRRYCSWRPGTEVDHDHLQSGPDMLYWKL